MSIAGHVILATLANFWFHNPSSAPESTDREPIEFVVINTPETEPTIDPQRRANINSIAGGQQIANLPTNAEQASRISSSPSVPPELGPKPNAVNENTPIRDNSAPDHPLGQPTQTSPSQAQSAEESSPIQTTNTLGPTETTPELSKPLPQPLTTPPPVSRIESSAPDRTNRQSVPSPPPSLAPTRSTSQADFNPASTISTSAADLLLDSDSPALVAQSREQLFNPDQTGAAIGLDAVRDDIWGAYLARLRQSIVNQWRLIQIDQSRQTRVQFTIDRQGGLSSVRLTQSSGFRAADEAALRAVRSAAPFGSFPNRTDKTSLTVGFTFTYTLY